MPSLRRGNWSTRYPANGATRVYATGLRNPNGLTFYPGSQILYTVVNSNAMNGWSASDTLKTVLPWWQTAIYALIAVLAVLTVLCAWQLSKALKRKKELADTAPAVDQK